MSDKYTRQMLTEIRKRMDELNKVELPTDEMVVEQKNVYDTHSIIVENEQNNGNNEDDDVKENEIVIKQNDVQFGSVRVSQEDAIRKTIGDVTLKPDALKYYPDLNDLVINGEVTGVGLVFQFRYKDPSGDGCYIWAQGLQMTDSNLKTIEKIRDAFLNWKQSISEDGDLLDKLEKQANKSK